MYWNFVAIDGVIKNQLEGSNVVIKVLFARHITSPTTYTHTQRKKKLQVKVTLRPTISRPVRVGVRRPSETRDQFFYLLEIFFKTVNVCYVIAPSLTRGRVCNWSRSCGRQSGDQFVWVSGLSLGPLTRFYLALLSSSDIYFILLSKAPSLTRKRVCSLQCKSLSSQVINAQ
jgi:hypothetical protein